MTKQLTLLLSVVLLAACSDGGSSSGASSVDGKANFNSADFTITQITSLSQNGESQLSVQLHNLATDDEVYLTANSDDSDNGKLSISPYRAILNPNKGSAQILLSVKDLGLSSQPNVTIEVTTSGNAKMEQVVSMEWVN